MADIILSPQSCLQDEKVAIKVKGLMPFEAFTISSHLQDIRGINFFAYAHYNSTSTGVIDVSQHESLGGHYTGVFQMGLISALQPSPFEYKYFRFFKRNVEQPNDIEIRLYKGHLSPKEVLESPNLCITKQIHTRLYMGPGVQRIPIRQGRVRGTLFIPQGDGPFPGVIDMFGTAGGLLEYRAAQLATKGVAAFALAFFNFEDLPEHVKQLDISYFREAAHVLLGHKKVIKPQVGVIGVSKGADLALTMGTYIPEVGVSVAINGSCYNLSWAMKIDESTTLAPLHLDFANAEIINKTVMVMKHLRPSHGLSPDKIIPIHKSNTKYFFVLGEDDMNMNGKIFSELATKHMDEAGKSDNYEIRIYKGAGHLIEPPYSPFCFASYHRILGFALAWGGELKTHTEAQVQSWDDMLSFIKKNLRKRESKL